MKIYLIMFKHSYTGLFIQRSTIKEFCNDIIKKKRTHNYPSFPINNKYVTPRELMRLFEGDIKTDILNSTYFSISKEHFNTNTIFISYSYQKLINNSISNCLITLKITYQDMGMQFIDLYTNLL